MQHPKGDGTTFEARPTQATHWYRSVGDGRAGWTSDPRQAMPGEIARAGLHDCAELACDVHHANDRIDYEKE